MVAVLQRNTVQRVQQFLTTLDVQPAPYATSQEVVELLVARVRERRDQIAFRHDLQALIRSLETDGGHLLAPGCETRSPEALAHELEQLLADAELPTGNSPALRNSLGALAATMLWAAVSTNTGCDPVGACIEDVSVENFESIAARGKDVEACQVEELAEQFEGLLSQEEQAETIDALCQMSPADITSYLESNFVVPSCTSGDDDTFLDDDDTYKGVSF